jgi:hypothetical protein
MGGINEARMTSAMLEMVMSCLILEWCKGWISLLEEFQELRAILEEMHISQVAAI